MKTTLDISDALLEQAKSLAAQEGVTLRSLVEQGLQNVMQSRHAAKPFRLRDASIKGKGLNPDFADADWSTVRDMIYEGRGS